MKQGRLKHTFVGCNTPQGYHSFAEEDLQGIERVFMLLGAPGCGKSGIIARLAQSLRERGLNIEVWQTAKEVGAPEGIIIPELSAAVIDAGFLEYVHPQNPGVVEDIYNLGDCWEQEMLRCNQQEIKKLNAEIKENMLAESRLLAIYQQEQQKLYAARGISLTEAELDNVCGSLAKELFSAKNLQVRRFFASVYTDDGLISYAQELSAVCKRRFLICGDSAKVLARVYAEGLKHGHSVDLYYDMLEPEQIQMLIFPQLSVALVDSSLPDLEPLYTDELVEAGTSAVGNQLRQHPLTEENDWQDLSRISEENINRLAAYYTAAMNFEQTEKIYDDIITKLWQMAAERGC